MMTSSRFWSRWRPISPWMCGLVLGTASVLLILLAVVVWFTLPERKIRQLGKQRATPH
ncbi:hypothetical protein ACVVI8_004878 [Escherichia coli]